MIRNPKTAALSFLYIAVSCENDKYALSHFVGLLFGFGKPVKAIHYVFE